MLYRRLVHWHSVDISVLMSDATGSSRILGAIFVHCRMCRLDGHNDTQIMGLFSIYEWSCRPNKSSSTKLIIIQNNFPTAREVLSCCICGFVGLCSDC